MRPPAEPCDSRSNVLASRLRRSWEHQVFDLFGGAPQARAENSTSFSMTSGIVAQQRRVAPLDDDQADVGERGGIGGARLAVEQGDLAEDFAFFDLVEEEALPVARRIATPRQTTNEQVYELPFTKIVAPRATSLIFGIGGGSVAPSSPNTKIVRVAERWRYLSVLETVER